MRVCVYQMEMILEHGLPGYVQTMCALVFTSLVPVLLIESGADIF